jgi:hypothetical protein
MKMITNRKEKSRGGKATAVKKKERLWKKCEKFHLT